MGLESVVPGRYAASIVDWGVSEVEQLEGALQPWISFEFKDQANVSQKIVWKSLLYTKAGDLSKKVLKTLEAVGFESMDLIKFMDDPAALNTSVLVDITIEDKPSKDGSKIYKEVAWVNKTGDAAGGLAKPEGEAKMSIQQKLARAGLGKVPPKKGPVKNYAPPPTGSPAGPSDDQPDSELGF